MRDFKCWSTLLTNISPALFHINFCYATFLFYDSAHVHAGPVSAAQRYANFCQDPHR